ncbi:hypothetical protein pb186bvf_015321 [Paramecium bursaria]
MNENMYSEFDGFKKVDDDYLGFVEYYQKQKQQLKDQKVGEGFYKICLNEWKYHLKSDYKDQFINSVKIHRKRNKEYFNEYMFQFENYCRQIKDLSPLKYPTDFLHYTYDQKQDFQNKQDSYQNSINDSPKKVLAIGKVHQVHEIEKQLKQRIAQNQNHFKREEKYKLIRKDGQQQNN